MGVRGLARLLETYRTAIEFVEVQESLHEHDQSAEHSAARDNNFNNDVMIAADGSQQPHPQSPSPRPGETGSTSIVIDGPALAYHAYYSAFSHHGNHARNALDAMPSYGDVNERALEMLDTLQKCGLEISALFFDGALPEGKRPVRMQRLGQYLMQLQNYRALHSMSSSPSAGAGDACTNYRQGAMGDPLSSGRNSSFNPVLQIPAKFKTLPALPFLVPSVIEAVLTSQYGHLATVVPGEADHFCAAYARKHGAMVLTSDSDLLAYDLGDNGSVALLKDVEMHAVNGRMKLRMTRFETARIAKRLELDSLQPVAFVVNEDVHRTIKQHTKDAQKLQQDPSLAYLEFKASYCTESLVRTNLEPGKMSSSVFGRLDPRVSELVHGGQSGLMSLPEELRVLIADTAELEKSRMYLPVLIEDTTRSSAWEGSDELRLLAYSLLRPSKAQVLSTVEIKRRGDRIVEAEVEHLDIKGVEGALQSLSEYLDHLWSFQIPDLMRWHFITMHQLCRHAMQERKRFSSKNVLKQLLRRQRFLGSWESVQWSAQFDGIAYSFRMLHQCCSVLETQPNNSTVSLPAFKRCLQRLRTTPMIPSWLDENHGVTYEVADDVLNLLYEALGKEEVAAKLLGAMPSSKKRKKRKKAGQAQESVVKKPLNMFSLLSTATAD
jgi:hypothetical protein